MIKLGHVDNTNTLAPYSPNGNLPSVLLIMPQKEERFGGLLSGMALFLARFATKFHITAGTRIISIYQQVPHTSCGL